MKIKLAAIFVAILAVVVLVSIPTQAPPPTDSKAVLPLNDRPLLTDAQIQEALETQVLAFDAGGEHYVMSFGYVADGYMYVPDEMYPFFYKEVDHDND